MLVQAGKVAASLKLLEEKIKENIYHMRVLSTYRSNLDTLNKIMPKQKKEKGR